jgi:two-component system phosphate regulon sensor histidine kinase PhoR
LERTANTSDPPAEIAAAVAATMELYQAKLAVRKIVASVEIAQDLPRVRISDDDLKTILSNLVGNAVKYGRDNGTLQLRAALRDGKVLIEVADSGIGIRVENLPQLFQEFFREKRSETRDIDGNGLGLAIVKRLVERTGGSVDVKSTVGVGSTFRVTLCHV